MYNLRLLTDKDKTDGEDKQSFLTPIIESMRITEKDENDGMLAGCNKVIVFGLNDKGDIYDINYIQANFRQDSVIALCDCVKAMMREEMGY